MKIYVASSWRNERQPEVVAALRAAGHQVYDFRNPAPGNTGFGWKQCTDTPPPWKAEITREVLSSEIAEAGYKLDFNAMNWADACVMVQPCGRSAALELGWFAGAGRLTIALLADSQEPELMLKMADHICVSMEEVVAVLADAEREWSVDAPEAKEAEDEGQPPERIRKLYKRRRELVNLQFSREIPEPTPEERVEIDGIRSKLDAYEMAEMEPGFRRMERLVDEMNGIAEKVRTSTEKLP